MSLPACPDPGASLGQWNAYVAAGANRAERAARLGQCPERLRPRVEDHVRTVFALRTRGVAA
jgi:hypothetical protein